MTIFQLGSEKGTHQWHPHSDSVHARDVGALPVVTGVRPSSGAAAGGTQEVL
jgi:hypothetical protein